MYICMRKYLHYHCAISCWGGQDYKCQKELGLRLQVCSRPSAGLRQACKAQTPSTSDPKSLAVGSQLGLQNEEVKWLGRWSESIQNIHYMAWFVASDYVLLLQDSTPRLWAKFGELGSHFDKISSQSSYESNEGVHLEPENILYFRHDWTRLGISYWFWSITIQNSLLNHKIIPNS